MAGGLIRAGASTLTAVNLSFGAYLGLLTLAGVRRPGVPPPGNRATRFVILVPAHNEATIIADALRSFKALDYPSGNYAVHVVADNCVDATAAIVREHGWHVHERHDLEAAGKGPALNWLFDRIDAALEFDVVVVVDADTTLDPGFLDAMDRAFCSGATVAQGFYSVRNPGESTPTGIRYAALACRHHLRPLGRCRLGASCGLYGNGMAFRRDVLRRHRWSGHLVEDAEFQMELLLAEGTLVRYVPEARLEAEMPDTLDEATSQNQRWERGRIDLARQYLPRLVGGMPAARGRRIAYLDAVADHLVPPLSVVVALQVAGTLLSASTALTTTERRRRVRVHQGFLHLFVALLLGAHVLSGLHAVNAPPAVYRSLTRAPGAILWKIRLWVGTLHSGTDVSWTRTKRNTEG